MSWTDERVTLLKKLWGEGKTASEIAKILGGVTRNAVIGKAHRLKLSGRNSPIQNTAKKTAATITPSPTASNTNTNTNVVSPGRGRPKKQAPDMKNIPVKRIKLSDLKDRQCRFPLGDPREKDFAFCGCAAMPGIPYCAEHAKIAYQAATRKKLLIAEDAGPSKTKENEEEALDNLRRQAS